MFLEDPSEVTEGSHVASVEFGKMTNKFLAPVGGKFSWAKGIKQGRELPSNVLIGSVRKPFSTWASKSIAHTSVPPMSNYHNVARTALGLLRKLK